MTTFFANNYTPHRTPRRSRGTKATQNTSDSGRITFLTYEYFWGFGTIKPINNEFGIRGPVNMATLSQPTEHRRASH